jgi:hypothetical protein
VLGFRVGVRTGHDTIVRLRPAFRYRLKGKVKVARGKVSTVRVQGRTQLRFRLPRKMRRDFRRAKVPLKGARVKLRLAARLRLSKSARHCEQTVRTAPITVRVKLVSARVARYAAPLEPRRLVEDVGDGFPDR